MESSKDFKVVKSVVFDFGKVPLNVEGKTIMLLRDSLYGCRINRPQSTDNTRGEGNQK